MKTVNKTVNPLRSRNMALINSKNTRPEIEVRRLVLSLGYRFRLHEKDLPGKPDLVFPRYRKVIFVNGCFWHQHPRCRRATIPNTRREYWIPKLAGNRIRDRRTLRRLRSIGWKTLVLWECSLGDVHRTSARIQKFLGDPGDDSRPMR